MVLNVDDYSVGDSDVMEIGDGDGDGVIVLPVSAVLICHPYLALSIKCIGSPLRV